MHPYRIPGHSRQRAYLVVLAFASGLAAGAALIGGPWVVVPAMLAGYLMVWWGHEQVAWHWWRRGHLVPDLRGTWQGDGASVRIHQTWTRITITVTLGETIWSSSQAGWDGPVLEVLLSSGDHRCFAQWRPGTVGQAAVTLIPISQAPMSQPSKIQLVRVSAA